VTDTHSTDRLAPEVGDNALDVVVYSGENGEPVQLATFWQRESAVLVFLRHLACSFCREQVTDLLSRTDDFVKLGAIVVLVTVNRWEETSRFCKDRNLVDPFICVSDPDRTAYHAYSLSRGHTSQIFNPHVMARGVHAMLHGHFNGIPKADPFQMPGVFAVNQKGIVIFAHRHRDASDNPDVEDILLALEAGN
jgi:peroxiredoxin